MAYIITFNAPEAVLENAGGKGANLARLSRAGFPVPGGFILSTGAYREFVSKNGLSGHIKAALEKVRADDLLALAEAERAIRGAFSSGFMPPTIRQAILAAYAALGAGAKNCPPVAVRSSATAEDLPDLSFAGQQETFLNITKEDALLETVVECWSSLWSGRAIGYRLRNGVNQEGAALAVIVQEMVLSEISGVLFTANPLSGMLNESVIDAAFGLGEALVSGQVEPDHFVVESRSGAALATTLGAKNAAVRPKIGGGVELVTEAGAGRQTLSAAEIRQLAALGQQVQQEFGAPQDIEWASAGGQLHILQARPITSLFPVPQVSFEPLIVWFSFGTVQGLVGPITPLGRDTALHVAMGMGESFGVKTTPDKIKLFAVAGERIWVRISDVMRNPLGGRIFSSFLGFIEPSVAQILSTLASEPRLGAGKGRLRFSTFRRLAVFFLPIAAAFVRTMVDPQKARAGFEAAIEGQYRSAQIPPASDRYGRLANTVAFIKERVAFALPFLLPRFIPIFGPSMAALNLLLHISGDRALALEATRGLPDNVTTQMDLALWEAAKSIRADAGAAGLFSQVEAQALAERYLDGDLPPAAQAAVAVFMTQYGMRGTGEIDIGQARWREDPAPVMQTLKSYMQIDPRLAPDVAFARGEQAAQQAIEKLAGQARLQSGGWLKEKIVRGAARRLRLLMGVRESPKFFAVRMMGIARNALLEVGQEFVAAGALERPDDLFYLSLAELAELAQRNAPSESAAPENEIQGSWRVMVEARRSAYQRELRRKHAPRVLASDGRAFYEGIGALTDSSTVISGSPVSPGIAEGLVRVVLDPGQAQLAPGEILVCPGTDPAWTPLFLAAGGLVCEVGGMMTHGSVVAREYGIPAVVGVHQATQRLKDGQRIRVDGSQGKITILPEAD